MNQSSAPTNESLVRKQSRMKISNSTSAVTSQKNDNAETEFSAEFVVGALLYSLFSSDRSEAVVLVLNEEERG